MRTAEEMYQYCLDNELGRAVSEKKGIKNFKLIEEALNQDEEVVVPFYGDHKYLHEKQTEVKPNFAFALTNKRIILAHKGLLGNQMQTISLKNLNDVTLDTSFLFGGVHFSTMKESFTCQTAKKSMAQNIYNKIQENLDV